MGFRDLFGPGCCAASAIRFYVEPACGPRPGGASVSAFTRPGNLLLGTGTTDVDGWADLGTFPFAVGTPIRVVASGFYGADRYQPANLASIDPARTKTVGPTAAASLPPTNDSICPCPATLSITCYRPVSRALTFAPDGTILTWRSRLITTTTGSGWADGSATTGYSHAIVCHDGNWTLLPEGVGLECRGCDPLELWSRIAYVIGGDPIPPVLVATEA